MVLADAAQPKVASDHRLNGAKYTASNFHFRPPGLNTVANGGSWEKEEEVADSILNRQSIDDLNDKWQCAWNKYFLLVQCAPVNRRKQDQSIPIHSCARMLRQSSTVS